MSSPPPPPDLIPYASHVAHGTGRTPIGIILFAAGHLMMGGVLAFAMFHIVRRYAVVAPYQMYFRIMLAGTSAALIAGGAMLLLKGRAAWILAIVSFVVLAMFESALAAGMAWWATRFNDVSNGAGLGSAVFALFALCLVVLGYLGSAKARNTFALPPGETPRIVRWLPKLMMIVFVAAVVAGLFIGRST